MTNNENEFEHFGKVYVAVKTEGRDELCFGCSFNHLLKRCTLPTHPCSKSARQDSRNVIFKEKV